MGKRNPSAPGSRELLTDLWSRYDATREGDAETPKGLFLRCSDAGQHWLVF